MFNYNIYSIFTLVIIIIILIILVIPYNHTQPIEDFSNRVKKKSQKKKKKKGGRYNWGIYPKISGYNFSPAIVNGILLNERREYPAKPSVNCIYDK